MSGLVPPVFLSQVGKGPKTRPDFRVERRLFALRRDAFRERSADPGHPVAGLAPASVGSQTDNLWA